ncbi:hypothetical protein GT347_02360 [Xylophilus rhododendri]|uniref:Uncharacterized protein n=1 Tax=Xylophilus rhododendri TaxID=2697032 RepID=A0A857J1G4_9BURK|nr:hypothetical protein [Xylophilus rhododendri]QHI96931.1 hypothetical protein GT347_02360 [Xylophilus rhododendri]
MGFPLTAGNAMATKLVGMPRFPFRGTQDSAATAEKRILMSVADSAHVNNLENIGAISSEMVDLLQLRPGAIAGAGEVHYDDSFKMKRALEKQPPSIARTRRLTDDMQILLDNTINNAVGAYLVEMGQPGFFSDNIKNPATKAAIDLGQNIARAIKPHLNEYERQMLRSSSAFSAAFKNWVEVYAYRLVFGGVGYEEDGKNIVEWVRQEAAQLDSQADYPAIEESLRRGYKGGLQSKLVGKYLHQIPLSVYPNVEDMENYAPCNTDVLLYAGNKRSGQHSVIHARVGPERCKGNVYTDASYRVARFWQHTAKDHVRFSLNEVQIVPRGVVLPTGEDTWSRNCGPDNILTRRGSFWDWFNHGAPACPPYVSLFEKWRETLKNGIVNNFKATLPNGMIPQSPPRPAPPKLPNRG